LHLTPRRRPYSRVCSTPRQVSEQWEPGCSRPPWRGLGRRARLEPGDGLRPGVLLMRAYKKRLFHS
jgi:hypothetical protein